MWASAFFLRWLPLSFLAAGCFCLCVNNPLAPSPTVVVRRVWADGQPEAPQRRPVPGHDLPATRHHHRCVVGGRVGGWVFVHTRVGGRWMSMCAAIVGGGNSQMPSVALA